MKEEQHCKSLEMMNHVRHRLNAKRVYPRQDRNSVFEVVSINQPWIHGHTHDNLKKEIQLEMQHNIWAVSSSQMCFILTFRISIHFLLLFFFYILSYARNKKHIDIHWTNQLLGCNMRVGQHWFFQVQTLQDVGGAKLGWAAVQKPSQLITRFFN